MSVCPWCREELPRGAAAACPRCGKELTVADGKRLRPLDIEFEAILADADAAALLWTKRGALFALVLAAIAIVPVLTPFAFLLLLLGQLFWARFLVSRRYIRHFASGRRLVTRWLSRLVMLWFLLPLHGSILALVVLPGAGLIVSPALFAGICWALRSYFRFHLLREHRHEGVLFVEKLLVVVLSILLVVALVVIGLLVWAGMSLLPGGK